MTKGVKSGKEATKSEGTADTPAHGAPGFDEVGYKKPPVKHRFKKGVSGNPAGRKPSNHLTKARLSNRSFRRLLQEEFVRKHTVSSGGVQTEMEVFRIAVRNMLTTSAKDANLARHLLRYYTEMIFEEAPGGYVVLDKMTDEDLAALEAIYSKYV